MRPQFEVDQKTWRVTCPNAEFTYQSLDEIQNVIRGYLRRPMTEALRACLQNELQAWVEAKIQVGQIWWDPVVNVWTDDGNLDKVTSFGVPYGRCSGDLP